MPEVDSLYSLEEHKHLELTDSAIPIRVTGQNRIVDRLVVHRRCQPHHQAQVTVRIVELVALQLPAIVSIISLVYDINVVSQKLIVVASVPTTTVVHKAVAVHVVIVMTVISPAIERTAKTDIHSEA